MGSSSSGREAAILVFDDYRSKRTRALTKVKRDTFLWNKAPPNVRRPHRNDYDETCAVEAALANLTPAP
jgi:hypothetical protein